MTRDGDRLRDEAWEHAYYGNVNALGLDRAKEIAEDCKRSHPGDVAKQTECMFRKGRAERESGA